MLFLFFFTRKDHSNKTILSIDRDKNSLTMPIWKEGVIASMREMPLDKNNIEFRWFRSIPEYMHRTGIPLVHNSEYAMLHFKLDVIIKPLPKDSAAAGERFPVLVDGGLSQAIKAVKRLGFAVHHDEDG